MIDFYALPCQKKITFKLGYSSLACQYYTANLFISFFTGYFVNGYPGGRWHGLLVDGTQPQDHPQGPGSQELHGQREGHCQNRRFWPGKGSQLRSR